MSLEEHLEYKAQETIGLRELVALWSEESGEDEQVIFDFIFGLLRQDSRAFVFDIKRGCSAFQIWADPDITPESAVLIHQQQENRLRDLEQQMKINDAIRFLEEQGIEKAADYTVRRDAIVALIKQEGGVSIPQFLLHPASRVQPTKQEPAGPLFPMPEGTFCDLTIKVLSDEYLEFSAPGAELKRLTFADCNMYSWKKKKLNRVGNFLLRLADSQGRTKEADLDENQRNGMKRLATDIRKTLRAITGIEEDPFHRYNQKDGYKLKCTLVNAAPSHNDENPPKSIWEQAHEV